MRASAYTSLYPQFAKPLPAAETRFSDFIQSGRIGIQRSICEQIFASTPRKKASLKLQRCAGE